MRVWPLAVCLLGSLIIFGCATIQSGLGLYQYGDKDTWQSIRWGGIVRQELDFSCGLTSIATVLRYHYGDESVTEHVLLDEFVIMLTEEELSEVLARGASMAQLADLLTRREYVIRSWRVDIPRLRQLTAALPAIVYLEKPHFRHFAVVRGVSEYQVLLADSARGNIRLSLSEFQDEWKGGRALFVAKDDAQMANALLATPDATTARARAAMARSVVTNLPDM